MIAPRGEADVAPWQAGLQDAGTATPSVGDSSATTLLPFVLSVIAGSVDVIGFLGLGGLFTAHITGNLVILAARFLAGGPAPVAHLISVPMFVVALFLTRLLAGGLEQMRIASLRPLLLLQFALLCLVVAISAAEGPRADPNATMMVVAGMAAVCAMAVQNALVRHSLTGAPSTAVMTTNITVFTMDVGEILFGRDPANVAKSRDRARHTATVIVGFLLGCALGAPCEAAAGLYATVLPASLALVAVALGMAADLHQAMRPPSVHEEKSP
ncbi:MAG TPA: YoaK family protein [Bradyrhizobium sp.]|nr:YoaK family protein [Bradyrhizobium sp.]